MDDGSGWVPNSAVALLCVDLSKRHILWTNQGGRDLLIEAGASDIVLNAPVPGLDWLWGLDVPPPGWQPLAQAIASGTVGSTSHHAWPRLVASQPEMWLIAVEATGTEIRLMCCNAAAATQAAAPDAADLRNQRDLLVREVHHRLKNNLQGVSGLLRHQAALQPAAAPWLESAAAQLQAMAQVYGLQLPDGQPPDVFQLVDAVARTVGALFGVQPHVHREAPVGVSPDAVSGHPVQAGPAWDPSATQALRTTLWAHLGDASTDSSHRTYLHRVHPDQAGGLALVLNELMTNALKHGTGAPCAADDDPGQGARLSCSVRWVADRAEVDIGNPGHWPSPPRLESLPPGVQGLALVRALLPSRGAELEFITQPGWVCARLHIRPPVLCHAGAVNPQWIGLDNPTR